MNLNQTVRVCNNQLWSSLAERLRERERELQLCWSKRVAKFHVLGPGCRFNEQRTCECVREHSGMVSLSWEPFYRRRSVDVSLNEYK